PAGFEPLPAVDGRRRRARPPPARPRDAREQEDEEGRPALGAHRRAHEREAQGRAGSRVRSSQDQDRGRGARHARARAQGPARAAAAQRFGRGGEIVPQHPWGPGGLRAEPRRLRGDRRGPPGDHRERARRRRGLAGPGAGGQARRGEARRRAGREGARPGQGLSGAPGGGRGRVKTPRDVIIRPVVSEKSYAGLEQNPYTFLVDPRANKTEIKEAVQVIWNVHVLSVRTL